MKLKISFVFTRAPFGSSQSREGLDALLAASAFCEEAEIGIFFLHDGVFNLLAAQSPEQLLQKDHIAAFKLIELYDLPHCYLCQDSASERGLSHAEWVIAPHILPRAELLALMAQAEKILTF